MKKQEFITFTKEQNKVLSEKLKDYIGENFDTDIGNLQSSLFLDFITENLGVYYYNKGISDSQSYMSEKTEDMFILMKDEN